MVLIFVDIFGATFHSMGACHNIDGSETTGILELFKL
jgi:hypothetical protein